MKILASDLDGTLVFDGKIKAEDVQAILEFQKQGNLFGYCTGRAYYGAKAVDDRIQPDFTIASSGAVIVDKNHQMIYQRPLPFEIIKTLFYQYQNVAEMIIQVGNDHMYGTFQSPMITHVERIEDIQNETFYSLSLIFDTEALTRKVNEQLTKDYPSVVGWQNLNSIDIVAKECSKGNALNIVKAYFQAIESVAIGDSYNDLPMLEVADTSFTFYDAPQNIQTDQRVASVREAIEILLSK